jgi:hypothetical protein
MNNRNLYKYLLNNSTQFCIIKIQVHKGNENEKQKIRK